MIDEYSMTEDRSLSRPDISLSVFFPAYNEEENIAETVNTAEEVLTKITDRYEIIVVDDGSRDRTAAVVEGLRLHNSHLRLVRHETNQGYGAALWSGIQAARYEWLFFTDADLQFRLEEIDRLLAYVPMYEAVVGYRAPRRDPFMRLVNAKGWNFLNRALFDLKVKDVDCAFKLFRRDLIANLPLEARGAMMSAELLIRLQRKGVLTKEVPVTHLPRKRGSPTGAKPAVIIRAFREMLRLYRGGLKGPDTTYVQVAKFASVGVVNTLVDVVAYFVLTRFTNVFVDHILAAKLLSFLAGSVCSFVLNRRYTFAVRGRFQAVEVIKFYSTIGMSVAVNVFTLYVFTSLLHIYDLIAVGLSTVFTFISGFIFSKFWVFRKKKQDPRVIASSLRPVL